MTTSTETPELRRELRLADATAIVVGTIIGSGIFLVPSAVAAQLESLSAVLLVWVVAGLLSLAGALALGEMGAAFPRAGGLYVYLRHAYGKPVGFLYGWALLSMIHSGSIATLAVAFSLYCAHFLPIGYAGQKVIAITCILLLTAVNCVGVRAGKLVQNTFTACKLGGLILMTVLLFAAGGPRPETSLWPAEMQPAWVGFGVALVAVLWAYEGWHVVSFTAGEVKDPVRILPRSLAIGTLIILVTYVAATLAYYAVLTPAEMRATDRVAAVAVTSALGPAASAFISALILVSIFGAMNGMILTGPRVYYAMARDGLFFQALGRTSHRFRTPVAALLVQGAWASALTLFGGFRDLFTYVIFTAWIFYGLAVAGVIVLRIRRPDVERPFRVPGYPFLPAAFVIAAIGITLNTIVADPFHALIGIGFVLLGVIVYAGIRLVTRPKPAGMEVGSKP